MSTHTQSMMTVADLELMPDDFNRYEMIEGEILVSCSPGLTHQEVVARLLTILMNYLAQHSTGKVYVNPGVILDTFNSVIPDIAFVSRERQSEIASAKHITGAPDLMIEVVSAGNENARRDRVLKRELYGSHSVQEYWIVDPERRSVEVYRLNENSLELHATYLDEDVITSQLLPGLSFSVVLIFET